MECFHCSQSLDFGSLPCKTVPLFPKTGPDILLQKIFQERCQACEEFMSEGSPSPERIRQIRGDLSRAAFAEMLGVTALTVYRWELPPDAPEARRPRAAAAKRILRLAESLERPESPAAPAEAGQLRAEEPGPAEAGQLRAEEPGPAGTEGAMEEALPAALEAAVPAALEETPPAAPEETLPVAPHVVSPAALDEAAAPVDRQPLQETAPAPQGPPEADLESVLNDMLQTRWQSAEQMLLELLSGGSLEGKAARSHAQIYLALIQLLGRGEVRAAFGTLLPVLADSGAGALPAEVAAWAHTAGALVFAVPDGQLFDVGKVNAHISRARRLLGGAESGVPGFLLAVAELRAVLQLGDPSLGSRLLNRHQKRLEGTQEPLLWCLSLEVRGLGAALTDRPLKAMRLLETLRRSAQQLQHDSARNQALAHLSLLSLQGGEQPANVLALAKEARDVAHSARLDQGQHDLVLLAAESSSLRRLGRLEEAEQRIGEGLKLAARLGWPPFDLVLPQIRLFLYTGRLAPFDELLESLAPRFSGLLREKIGVTSEVLKGLRHLARDAIGEATECFDKAVQELTPKRMCPELLQASAILSLAGRIHGDSEKAAWKALRRAQRLLDHLPSVQFTAELRLHEALLRALTGQLRQAARSAETALTLFRMAGDRPQAAAARIVQGFIATLGDPAAGQELLASALAELQGMGAAAPPTLALDRLRALASRGWGRKDMASPDVLLADLQLPIERLALRNLPPERLLRELLEALPASAGARDAGLDELSTTGARTRVAEIGTVLDHEPKTVLSFGDNLGRQFELSVFGGLSETQQGTLGVLTTVSSLALEVSALRRMGERLNEEEEQDEEDLGVAGFVAVSEAMRSLRRDISRLGRSDATVLISGDSGTGKEVVAHAIHRLSKRSGKPYVTLNCSAVPRELFEAQLFGHRKGAFTGAINSHPGVIRAAHKGTLFLDEIGDLPLELQPKLLRFLENSEILPVGEQETLMVDVRVIAATHKDLEEMVAKGLFREDLFYRLQVVPLSIPPLRERKDDILALARSFVQNLTPPGDKPPSLSPDAVATLFQHSWPGNVRELRNVMARALAFSPVPPILTSKHLRIERAGG
jgi:hydrogenase-4 transcriptional activator